MAPGHYLVRLIAGGASQTRNLEVRIDPRVYADGISPADLQAQEAPSLQIRDAIAAGGRAAWELEQLRENVTEGAARRAARTGAAAAAGCGLETPFAECRVAIP